MVQRIICLIYCLFLTACHREPLTVNYLIENPMLLEKELQICLSADEKSPDQIARCKIIAEAQNKIKNYIYDQQIDPEGFGQRILKEEQRSGQLKIALDKAKQALAILQAKNAPASKLQVAQIERAKAEKAYLEKQQEVKILLAVTSLNSPE